MAEQASAGSTTGTVTLPSMTSAVNSAPASGTLYTAARPAPAPQAISSRRCAGDSRAQPASTLADAPPISLGAFSRPIDAPIPMTNSDSTEVPSERRNDRCARLPQTTSSSSDFSPLVCRRSRYQPTPPTAPAMSSTVIRRSPDACSAAASSVPL